MDFKQRFYLLNRIGDLTEKLHQTDTESKFSPRSFAVYLSVFKNLGQLLFKSFLLVVYLLQLS